MPRTVSRVGCLLLILLSACGGCGDSYVADLSGGGGTGGGGNGGSPGTPVTSSIGSYQPFDPMASVETIGGMPVVRLFGTTWCPRAAFIADMFDRVAREYVTAGKIVAYHWQLDTNDDILTYVVETAVPYSELAVFYEFSPGGSVPLVVIGGKYYRLGTAYEGVANGLSLEEKDLRAAIEEVIRAASVMPSATTMGASSVTADGGTFNGYVNPNGQPTSCWFEWGTDPTLMNPRTTSSQFIASGSAVVSVSRTIGGLADNTACYFRLVARNSGGTSKGFIGRFVAGSDNPSGVIFDVGITTVLRGVLIDNPAGAALAIPAGYYRIREFRSYTDTTKNCIAIGISRNYLDVSGNYAGSSFPIGNEEWVFSVWDSSTYNSDGRIAAVRDLHGHTLSFDIRFGQPTGAVNTVVSATLDGVPIGFSTQNYVTQVLNTYGWSGEPSWTIP